MATAREKLEEVLDMLETARDNAMPWIANRKQQIADAEVGLRQRQARLRAIEAGIRQINQLLEFLPEEDE